MKPYGWISRWWLEEVTAAALLALVLFCFLPAGAATPPAQQIASPDCRWPDYLPPPPPGTSWRMVEQFPGDGCLVIATERADERHVDVGDGPPEPSKCEGFWGCVKAAWHALMSD